MTQHCNTPTAELLRGPEGCFFFFFRGLEGTRRLAQGSDLPRPRYSQAHSRGAVGSDCLMAFCSLHRRSRTCAGLMSTLHPAAFFPALHLLAVDIHTWRLPPHEDFGHVTRTLLVRGSHQANSADESVCVPDHNIPHQTYAKKKNPLSWQAVPVASGPVLLAPGAACKFRRSSPHGRTRMQDIELLPRNMRPG